MMSISRLRISLLVAILLLAACGTIATPEPSGGAARADVEAETDDTDEAVAQEAGTTETEATDESNESDVPEGEVVEETTSDNAAADGSQTEADHADAETDEQASADTESGDAVTETDEQASADTEGVEVAAADAAADESIEINGDPVAGQFVFQQAGCVECHNPNSEERLVGPGLANIRDRARTRVEGMSAVDYIRQSILDPQAFVVEDYPPLMPATYSQLLNAQQVNDLIAYLITLEGPAAAEDTADSSAVDEADTSAEEETVTEAETTSVEEAGDQAEAVAEDAAADNAAAESQEAEASAVIDGDVTNGETLFVTNGCVACHNTTSDDTLVGPGLLTIAERAGSRVEGMSAVEYVRHSLMEPTAFVVEGFPPVMPSFASLSEQDINDLIAYLFSLNG